MADKLWKRHERVVSRICGTERTGPTGRDTFDCVNHVHGFGVEVKSRKKLPKWLKDAMEQSEDHKRYEQEKHDTLLQPIVVLVEKGMRDHEILCMMRLEEYMWLQTQRGKE